MVRKINVMINQLLILSTVLPLMRALKTTSNQYITTAGNDLIHSFTVGLPPLPLSFHNLNLAYTISSRRISGGAPPIVPEGPSGHQSLPWHQASSCLHLHICLSLPLPCQYPLNCSAPPVSGQSRPRSTARLSNVGWHHFVTSPATI